MKERKELTIGKALAYIIVLYLVFTIVFGLLLTLIINLLANFIPYNILSIIAIISSLVTMYLSWKFSIIGTFKDRPIGQLNTKRIIGFLILFVVIVQTISIIFDIDDTKKIIEERYQNDFLNDRDVIAALTQEELQERANENNNAIAEAKKQTYPLMIGQNIISVVINILIISLSPKKMLDKYNGITKREKEIER